MQNGVFIRHIMSSQINHDRPLKAVSGTLKTYNWQKGYGFLIADSNVADTFVHAKAFEKSGISPELVEAGQRYQFDVVRARSQGKYQADNLRRLIGSEPSPPDITVQRAQAEEEWHAHIKMMKAPRYGE